MTEMKRFLYLLLFSIFTISGSSQNSKIEKIEKFFEKYNDNTPGCAIGVVKDGELIYQKGFGSSCLDYSVPNNINTKFFIGSITKQFTGACIAYLVLEEKVNANDDIRKYIPEFPFYGDTIRVKNLLHHTSGIKNYETAMDMSGIQFDNYYSDYNHLLKLIINQSHLDFKPNTKFSYSNSNYTLLAEIVQRVSRKSIEKFAEEKLFNPIGMYNTFYWNNPKEVIKGRAIGYKSLVNGEYEINHPHGIPFGSGNMISTVKDLSKWATFLVEQHCKNTDFIKAFTETCNTKDTDYESAEYAFGIDVLQYRGLLKYEHNGGMLGFCSRIAIYPEQGLSIIILGNISDIPINPVTSILSDFYLKNLFTEGSVQELPSNVTKNQRKEDIITIDTINLIKYVGYYKFGKGYIAEVQRTNQGLSIYECWNNSEYKVYPISDSSFIDSARNVRFDFHKMKNDVPKQMVLQSDNGKEHKAKRESIESLDSLFQAKLSGFYFNADLNIVYHIYPEQGNLWLRIGNEIPLRLVVENKGLMSFFGYEAKIISDDNNQITGFEILKYNNFFTKISEDI
jgi:CubicO group peptidase (beta-lactamase class C family)